MLCGHSFAQQDVGIQTLISPISGCNVGTANHVINVVVRNYSPSPIAPGNVTVRYQVNSNPIVSQVIGSFLAPNATFNFTFSQTQNFSACNQWNVKIWTSYATDPNHLNDTITTLFVNDCTPIPGAFVGPANVCDGNDFDSIMVAGGSYGYGLQWYSQILPAGFTATGNTSNKIYLNNITSPTNFQIVYPGGLCPDVTSPTFSVGVSPPLNTGIVSPDMDFCSSNVVGDVQISGFTSTLVSWEQSADGGSSWASLGTSTNPYSITGYSDSTLFRALISSGGCGSDYSDTIAVNIEPVIIPGTISNDTNVCESSNTGTLSVSGNSNYATQEWYISADNITFSPTGITANTYTYNNLTQTTYYKVIYTCNLCPNDETTVVTVTVDPAFSIGVNSTDLILCADNIVGSVSVSGFSTNITNWLESSNGLSFSPTGLSINPLDISGISSTKYYKAIIESGACGTDTTAAISVIIEPIIVPGTITGATTVCANSNSGILTLSGNANDFGIEWHVSTDNIAFTPSGITTSTYSYINLSQTTYFKVVLQGNQCADDETSVVVINVDTPLNVGSTSADLTLCETNVVGNISLSGFASSIVAWEQSLEGSGIWTLAGSNANPFSIAGTSATSLFRALVESGACGTAYSDTITVTIEPSIVTGTISGATTVCATSNSGNLSLTGNANDFGFEWYLSTDNITFSPTGINTGTYTYTNLTQTTYFKVVLQGNICSNDETSVVAINVDPALNVGVTSSDLVLCHANVVGNISLSGFSSSLIEWEQSIVGSGIWTSTGSNSSPYSIAGTSTSTLFRALVESGVCGTGYSDTITVTIEPSIVTGTISGATTVCATSNSGILSLTGNANDFGFEWYLSTDNISFSPTGVNTGTFAYTNLSQTTYFKVVLQGNICSNDETSVVVINVDPALNFGVTSSDLVLCQTNVVGNISLSGFASSIVEWEQSIVGSGIWTSTGSNSNPYSIAGTSVSTIFRALVESGVCGTGYSDTITVTIEPAIVPGNILGAINTCSGSNTGVLTLNGNANDFGLQWFTSMDGTNFSPTAETSNTYNYSNITQTTYYKVVLQGNSCVDAETPIVSITVDQPLNLGTVSSGLNLCANNVTGSVSVAGAVTLQDWEQSDDYGATWFTTSDNNPSHDISSLTDSAWFRAVISSGACGSGYSDTIQVNIEPVIIPGTISPSNITVCESSNSGTLTLSGNANDLGFQWYISTDNVFFLPTGNSTSTLNFSSLTQTTYFKVVLQGNVCSDVETPVVTVSVDPALNLGTTSADLLLCANSITGNVNITNAVNLINWEQSNDNGVTWSNTVLTTNTIDISYLTSSAWFRAVVSSGVCGTAYSDTVLVTIETLIIPGTISGPSTVCASGNSGVLTLTGNANQTALEWYSSTDNITFTPTGVTTNTYSFTNLTQTTFFQVVLQSNACSGVQTGVFTLAVDPVLNLGSTSNDLLLCADNITGNVGITGAINLVNWEQSINNGASWSNTGLTASTIDISYLTSSAWFRAVISSGVCGTAYSDTVLVTIETSIIPGTIAGPSSVCASGNSGVLTLTGSANSTAMEWYSSTDNVNFTATGVTTSTYSFTNVAQTTFFQVVLESNACSGIQTGVFILVVDPVLNLGTVSSDHLLCSSNVTGSVSVTGAVTLQDWQQSTNGGALWTSLGDNNPVHDISNLTTSTLFRALLSSGACGLDYSAIISVTIDQAGTPALIGEDFAYCIGSGNIDSVSILNYSGTISTWQTSSNGGSSWSSNGQSSPILYISNLLQTTIYQVITSHGACPDVASNIAVGTLAAIPSVYAGEDQIIPLGSNGQLTGSGGLFGIWTPSTYLSNPNLSSPLCTPEANTTYAYTVIDINGCTNTDYVTITVDTVNIPENEDGITIYNIITPNGDDMNEVFKIDGLEKYPNNKVLVFNGNGILIYSQEDYQNDWDGTYLGQPLPDGVYLFAIEVSRLTKHRGFITIMRDE